MKLSPRFFGLCWLIFATFSFETLAATSSAKILLFGDFGTGLEDQALVADDMAKFCQAKTCDFAITTGDNIYPRGVENLKNGKVDYDNGEPNYQIIKDIFVNFYQKFNMPFYMSYGNHDVGNEGPISIFKDLIKSDKFLKKRTIALMRNQVAFSNNKDNPAVLDGLGRPSRLWYFPDIYYKSDEKGGVNLYSIDTNTYPHRPLNQTNDAIHEKEKNFEQDTWLNANLMKTTGWKMVFGHMPLYSHGLHGWMESSSIKDFRKAIIDTLCSNKVDFYISGHDHHLEVDKHECDNGHVIVSVLTGAAAKRGRIYKSSFPIFSSETNLLWGNGIHYTGDKSVYTDDAHALGFSYLDIIDANKAQLTMKQTIGNSNTRSDGCFEISKGKAITKIPCK
jgi:hypothetical protein